MKSKIQTGKKSNDVQTELKDAQTECGCSGHHHGTKQIFIGLILLIIGAALNNGYSLPDVLVLIGGIMIVKGILIMACMKKCK